MVTSRLNLRETFPGRLIFLAGAVVCVGMSFVYGSLTAPRLAAAVVVGGVVGCVGATSGRSRRRGQGRRDGVATGSIAILAIGSAVYLAATSSSLLPALLGIGAGFLATLAVALPPTAFRKWSEIRRREGT
jgi:hypothetical protein